MEDSIFTLGEDDESYIGGGFNAFDMDELEDGNADDKSDDGAAKVPDATEKGDDAGAKGGDQAGGEKSASAAPDSTSAAAPDSAPDSAHVPPQKLSRNDDSSVKAFDFVLAQSARLQAELDATKEELRKARTQDLVEPTEDDWTENPNEAHKRMSAIERARADEEASAARAEYLRNAQQETYAQMASVVPGFKTDPVLRERWRNVFYSNPDYQGRPDGPLLAAQDVAKIFYSHQGMPSDIPQAQPDQQQQKPANDRDAKLKAGAMHGSGRGGGKTRVQTVDQTMRRLQRQMGVSDESLNAVLGGFGGEFNG